MGQYGPAGPPGETKDEKRARVKGLLERVKQRAMTAQTSPGNINWPEQVRAAAQALGGSLQ